MCLQIRKDKESYFSAEAALLLCSVSLPPKGSSLSQLWTLVLQRVHRFTLGPVWFIRRLLLSPVWTKYHMDSQSEQHCRK